MRVDKTDQDGPYLKPVSQRAQHHKQGRLTACFHQRSRICVNRGRLCDPERTQSQSPVTRNQLCTSERRFVHAFYTRIRQSLTWLGVLDRGKLLSKVRDIFLAGSGDIHQVQVVRATTPPSFLW
jgi:hypothetical protein